MMTTTPGDYVTEIARLFPRQGRWTEDDYFALPESSEIIELRNGSLIVSPAPDDEHQHVVVQLATSLNMLVMPNKRGIVRVAPYDVRLTEGLIRQPDVLFLREEHRHYVQG